MNFKNTISNIFRSLLPSKPSVVTLRISGIIGSGNNIKTGLNLERIDDKIKEAFDTSNVVAVALIINSPGGSPVQSELIFNRIRSLAEEKNVKVISFIEDVGASGGYWIACAADKIYAAQNSIIGSIGVVSASFGFDKAIEKLGINRRIYTEGNSKSILDPFLPEKKADIEILKEVQRDIYENFKELVLARRSSLKLDRSDDIFSGAFWSSKKSKELGLIDEIGNFHDVIYKKFGTNINIKKINYEKSWLKSLISSASDIIFAKLVNVIEQKSINSKFGL